MVGKMPQTTITHLSATGSDHYPLLMEMVSTASDYIKYFRFLNCWVDNPHFMETVKTWWEKSDRSVCGDFTKIWKGYQTLLVFGQINNFVLFSKRLGCMRNKCTKMNKTTSLTKVTQIKVLFMKLMQSTSSFSSLKTLFWNKKPSFNSSRGW